MPNLLNTHINQILVSQNWLPPFLCPDANPILADVLVHTVDSAHFLIVLMYYKWLIYVHLLRSSTRPTVCSPNWLDTKLVGYNVDSVVIIPTDSQHSLVAVISIVVRSSG